MDINDTRFHLVNKPEEWWDRSAASSFEDIMWNPSCGAVTLTPRLFRFLTPPESPVLGPGDRRGAGRDRYGNWYWISKSGTDIRFLSVDQRRSEHFWKTGDLVSTCDREGEPGGFQPLQPSPLPGHSGLCGLAVTNRHYLVVGMTNPAGLLAFDLHAGGPPAQFTWPEEVPFAPFDMAPAVDGGVWILDSQNSCVWKLDRYFQVEPGYPAPLEAGNAVSIEALPDGPILILDSDPNKSYSTVYRCVFDEGTADCRAISLEDSLRLQDLFEPGTPSSLNGHDMAFVPGEGDGTLYIADSGGNQAFAFQLRTEEENPALVLLPDYLPMRFYKGKALVATGQTAYYDMEERWLPLTRMPRPAYREEGWLILPRFNKTFDGKEPNCVWHRLFIDAYIPPGTQVRVESRASNQEDLLDTMDWKEGPPLYCRADGPELPYYFPFPSDEETPAGAGTWELLLQEAHGRFLQLKLTLTGPGNNSPRLYSLRCYYPRFSYLKEYLPALYREDKTSASFLDRFLANMEGFYTVMEGRIANVRTLFDVVSIPDEYLEWLAGWFGVVMDPAWDETRQRLFLGHAMELFKQRGTLAGLVRAIRLAVDPCPDDSLFEEDVSVCRARGAVGFSVRIVEEFLTRGKSGVIYGDPTDTGTTLPGLSFADDPWTPDMGAGILHQRFRDYLERQYGSIGALNTAWGRKGPGIYTGFQRIFLPPVKPSTDSKNEVRDWMAFLEGGIGFTYIPVDASDYSHRSAYRGFLARRYQQVDRLNEAYERTADADKLNSFEDVTPPEEIPAAGQPLADWILFVSYVMAIKEKAHRFIVLVPRDPAEGESPGSDLLERVRQIVELEKPAHTHFKVKPYWALFRVGTARVGLDTLPGIGSRFSSLVLGNNALAKSYLGAPHPWNVRDRRVVGRDSVGPGPTTWR